MKIEELQELWDNQNPRFERAISTHGGRMLAVINLAKQLLDVMAGNPKDEGTWREPIENLDMALNELERI